MGLKLAIEAAGSQAALARLLGVTDMTISHWKRRGVPRDRCAQVEKATSGVVLVEQIRPDIHWYRVKDPQWPHPKGRPLADFSVAA